MTGRRDQVARIREVLCCPQCEYSLRGVRGDVATCPECGTKLDLARLIVSQWSGPWYRAPGFNRVLAPVTWAAISPWGVLLMFAFELAGARTPVYAMAAGGAVVLVWIGLMWRLKRMIPGGAAMLLALLAHGILVGYAAGAVAVITLVWRAIVAGSFLVAAPTVAATLPALGLLWACRRGEKYIAQRCIRQHLVRMAQPDPPTPPR
ncbi:MAG: hypothetical protein ACYSU7_00760 [Planctomycetota bacterium]|jgi:hypothetical protein